MAVPLIAVIGAVEDELLHGFVDHYSGRGVEEFHVGFHFPDHVGHEERERTLDTWRRLVGAPTLVSTGPWHETLHAELRDRLRGTAAQGWQAIADSDEFHAYPLPLPELIDEAEASGHAIVHGFLLDRVASDGGLRGATGTSSLDRRYPLGGFITAELTEGCPRKIVLARSDVPLGLGSHSSPAVRYPDTAPVPVHHFKWRPPVVEDLRRRVAMHSSGAWAEETSAIRDEAERFLDHLVGNDGRINADEIGIELRPVSLDTTPEWWAADASRTLEKWRANH